MVEAKAKVRDRHSEAISEYKMWLLKNSNAPKKKKFKTFDMFVDSADLKRTFKK